MKVIVYYIKIAKKKKKNYYVKPISKINDIQDKALIPLKVKLLFHPT